MQGYGAERRSNLFRGHAEMYSALIDAPVNTDLELLEVVDAALGSWLQRLGLFPGSHLLRLDDEISFNPVRVRGTKGDVVVPAGLGIKVLVHSDSAGERKPLVELERGETGHIETTTCGRGCTKALEHLGLVLDGPVTMIRSLPHMDYITIVDRQTRTRLSEGEAARLWGYPRGGEPTQFYFARRREEFFLQEIIGGKKIQLHLKTHGIRAGCSLFLESIEQTQELHKPVSQPVTISSAGGLRLYLTPTQAGQVIVRSEANDSDPLTGQQQ